MSKDITLLREIYLNWKFETETETESWNWKFQQKYFWKYIFKTSSFPLHSE